MQQSKMMNDKTRTCQLTGHDEQFFICICVSLKCNQQFRLLCQTCLLQDIHNHDDGPKQNYIIGINKSQELERILKQRFQQIQQQTKERLIKYTLLIKQVIHFLQQQIEQVQKNYEDLFEKFSLGMLKNIVNENPFDIGNILKLNHVEIGNLFNIDSSKVNFNFIDDMMQIIQQGIQIVSNKNLQIQPQTIINKKQDLHQTKIDSQNDQVENLISQQKIKKPQLFLPKEKIIAQQNNNINDQLNILIDSQYTSQVIHQSKKDFYHAEISPNQQYLVYGGKDMRLFIYDLNRIKFTDKNLEKQISVCRFTTDSKFLFVGCDFGFLFMFQTENNFQQLCVHQYLFKDWIINIYPITSQEIILSSENSYVIRAQVQNQAEAQKIYCKDQESIFCLEYNKDLDIIIVAGEGKFIIALDGKNGNSLINKPQAHENKISQMQLMNSDKQLITLDTDGKFKWWNINYTEKQFQEIKNFHDSSNKIYGFYSVLDQQYLILIGEKSLNIIDQDNQIMIKKIEFSASRLFKFRQIHQLNTLKYILVPCERQLILFSR